MSDASQTSKKRDLVRRQRSIYQVHYCLQRRQDDEMAKPIGLPWDAPELQAYGQQVAGHQNHATDAKYLGLLQCNGKILKPILKEEQRREVEFYTRLAQATEPELVELRQYVPQYYGCRNFTYNGFEQEYIILEDLTDKMLEPCVMDVKIGRKTWDPLASKEKIEKEQSKYRQCKEEFGFCIPGYQVYRLDSGKLCKHGKDCGKKLHGPMVRAAVRRFLNGEAGGVRRALLLALLSALWALQRWAGRQCALRLRAASLLLVYDAARLRPLPAPPAAPRATIFESTCQPPVGRRKSIHSSHNPAGGGSAQPAGCEQASPAPPRSPWAEALDKLNGSHSFEHNYEDKLSAMKLQYRAQLERLSGGAGGAWAAVRLIDFAHASFLEEGAGRVDANFKDGIDGFVAVVESLLAESAARAL